METVPPKTLAVLLIVLSMEMLIPAALSQLLLPPGLRIPGPLPGFVPVDGEQIRACWSSLASVPSCAVDIVSSLALFRIGTISPACCNAINNVADKCWPKMFPWNPLTSQVLKSFCAAPARGLLPGLDQKLAPAPVPGLGLDQKLALTPVPGPGLNPTLAPTPVPGSDIPTPVLEPIPGPDNGYQGI